MLIATAGHVDHGKTTLIRALTGVDTDRLAEEQRRGLTIELGFAYKEINDKRIGFVDVPGHSKFLNTMLAGVAGIDNALLIVAADDGLMPQSLEHLDILFLLGISNGLVVLTKTDLVDEPLIQQRRREIKLALAERDFSHWQIMQSSPNDSAATKKIQEKISNLKPRQSAINYPQYFRLAVDRSFNLSGSGLIATGTVYSGELQVDASLFHTPRNTKARVRELRVNDSKATQSQRGDRCAINLASTKLEAKQLARGDWLLAQENTLLSPRLDIQLRLLPGQHSQVKNGLQVHIHIAASHSTGKLFVIGDDQQFGHLILDQPLHALIGDKVVIRDARSQLTLCGGQVLDPSPWARGRTKPQRQKRLSALLLKPQQAIEALIELEQCLSKDWLQRAYGTDDATISRWLKSSRYYHNELLITHGTLVEQAQQHLLKKIVEFHQSNPSKAGLSQNLLTAQMTMHKAIVDIAINQLLDKKQLTRQGQELQLSQAKLQLSSHEQQLWQQLSPLLLPDVLNPPVLKELAMKTKSAENACAALLKKFSNSGELTQLGKTRFIATTVIKRLACLVQDLAQRHKDGFLVTQFRDECGAGRNFCILVLEYFDGLGFTRRRGDKRIIGRTMEQFWQN